MAGDIYMKATDIEGESTDDAHAGEVEITSFHWGASMSVSPRSTAGSATQEKVNISDLTVFKRTDSATPAIFKSTCQGTHIPEVVISINRADGKGGKVEYLKYTLTDVVFSRFETNGADEGGLPTESICLSPASWKIEYVPTDPATGEGKGAKTAGWDLALNKPV